MAEIALSEGRLRSMVAFYAAAARTSIQVQFQYRAANYFYMIGMVVEPAIYLVVWRTIANANGGSVDGYTAGTFAAYYIVWTLVRNMNIVFTPFGWEARIREGELSGQLLRPLHPLHYDLAFFGGWKVVVIVMWLPIAAVLSLAFRPTLSPSWQQCVVFFFALWGAYLIRSMLLWVLGMVTFWTTRVAALYEAYFMAELLLSGRLVPMDLMPGWVQDVSWFLPFRWTFGYPITALVGPITSRELYLGLAAQAAWVVVGALLVRMVWRRGIRRFSAVGG
ncbi:MAG TPA: ABC-2 family transporter protein [Ilumatobacteraceae bacterium]|nr:ABC-2 family transporter protein [Ilumatobacteraceae bacterium]